MVNSLVLLLGLLGAAEIPQRVPNDQTEGVCYWACADSVLGTKMKDLVLETGFGRDPPNGGAGPKSIEAMCELFEISKLEMLTTPNVEKFVRAGKPVIAICNPWRVKDECHAIVVLDVQWVWTSRKTGYKRLVYYDPNHTDGNRWMGWSEFNAKFRLGHILEKK